MKLSVVMPAQGEEKSVGVTLENTVAVLEREGIDYEIVVVDDHSTDATVQVVGKIAAQNPRVRCVPSGYEPGYGFTVRAGLEEYTGDVVAVMMADGSDDPEDLVRYSRELEEGWECVFGSRFIRGATVRSYPKFKLVINRLANWFIKAIFRHHYNDTTNAFKAYRREVIDAIQPLLSNHFNLTVEMPLKAIVEGTVSVSSPSPGRTAPQARPSSGSARWGAATCSSFSTSGSSTTSAGATTGAARRSPHPPRPGETAKRPVRATREDEIPHTVTSPVASTWSCHGRAEPSRGMGRRAAPRKPPA